MTVGELFPLLPIGIIIDKKQIMFNGRAFTVPAEKTTGEKRKEKPFQSKICIISSPPPKNADFAINITIALLRMQRISYVVVFRSYGTYLRITKINRPICALENFSTCFRLAYFPDNPSEKK